MNDKVQSARSNRADKKNMAFSALAFFTFMVYIAPQTHWHFLQPFRLALVSGVLAGLTHMFTRSQGPKLHMGTETKCIFFIVFWALASVATSLWPGGSVTFFVEQYSKVIIIYALIANVLKSTDDLKKLIGLMLIFSSYIALVAIKNYVTGNFIGQGRIAGTGSALANNPNDLALTLNLMIPFALGFFEISNNRIRKLLCLVFLGLAVAAIVCTLSRGGFVVLAVIGAMWIRKMAKIKGPKMYLLALVLMICALTMLPGDYLERLSSITDFTKDETGSADERWEGTKAALIVMIENPILGVGLGMNVLAMNERGFFWTETHNVYLEYGADLGIPAMLVFIFLLYRLLKNMSMIQNRQKETQKRSEIIIMAQSTQISLIGFAVAGFLHPVAYNFYFYYIAGFAVALKYISDVAGSNKFVIAETGHGR